jgi:hypothetical protein
VSIDVGHEAPRDPAGAGPGFADAVTFAFGDPAAELYGIARVGLAGGTASGLALLFAGPEPVAVSAEGAHGVEGGGWEAVQAAGVRTTVEAPLQAWTVAYEGERASFDLRFDARSAPAVLDADQPAARAGGIEGYEQLCSVSGVVTVDGATREVRCLGQRGHTWGEPDWERIAIARTVTAWMDDERAVALSAVRPIDARHHLDEAVNAFYVEGGEPMAVDEPRLSTAYDGQGHQRRAGLELWLDEDSEIPRRLAGEVVAGTSLDLGRLRLDCAFFGWRMEGRTGIGRYDILRRVDEDGDGSDGSAA